MGRASITPYRSPPHVGQIRLHKNRVQAHPRHRQLRDVIDGLVGHRTGLEGGVGDLGAGDRVGRHRQARAHDTEILVQQLPK